MNGKGTGNGTSTWNGNGGGGPRVVLSLSGVTKSYPDGNGRRVILDGIDVEVRSGDMIGIKGPSGSGKTTLLHLLGLLDAPDAGVVRLRGEAVPPVQDGRLDRLRREHVGFVFQEFNLIPVLSALENAMLPLVNSGWPVGEQRARVIEVLTRVGLGRRLDHRPHELSGGEKQRVAIARALVHQPTIILADEPTGNLDRNTAMEITWLLGELRDEGRAIVIASHDPFVLDQLDAVYKIEGGRMVRDALEIVEEVIKDE